MITDEGAKNRPLYNYFEPVDLRNFASKDSIFPELVSTRAFQRLKSIRFLGGIDYLLVRSPNGIRGNIRHTRYQHSLGVARLALIYSNKRELPFADRQLVAISALLHDIGHAPLSHSLEPVFKELFGLEHHRATEDIITGRAALGREIYEILRRHQVDIEHVLAIISGGEAGYDGFFAGPINFDTIEAILRSQTYARASPNIPSPETVTDAALSRSSDSDRAIVDQFWSYKDQVYRYVINSRSGVLADFACQSFMRRHLNKITPDDYFLSEADMFRKLPGLRELLTGDLFESEAMRILDTSIIYKVRRFFVDPMADFFDRDDSGRYKQTKDDQVMLSHVSPAKDTTRLKRDLFDDDDGNRPSEEVFQRKAERP
jgi:predicted ATPase